MEMMNNTGINTPVNCNTIKSACGSSSSELGNCFTRTTVALYTGGALAAKPETNTLVKLLGIPERFFISYILYFCVMVKRYYYM